MEIYEARRRKEADRYLNSGRKNILVEQCMLKLIDEDDSINDEHHGIKKKEHERNLHRLPTKITTMRIEQELNDEVDDNISTEIDRSQKEKDPCLALENFYSYIFATALEEVLQSIYILEECNNSMRIRKKQQEMPVLLAKKYGILQEATEIKRRDELKSAKFSNLESYANKLNKMVNDRETFSKVMADTYKSLAVEQGFRPLWNYIKDIEDNEGREYFLEIDEVNNRMIARSLRRQKRQQCNQHKSSQYEVDGIIEKLRVQIEDADSVKETQCRYVDHWQSARQSQHQLAIQIEQNEQTNSTNYYNKRMELERVVHLEVEMFYNISIHETLDEVDKAMDKYDTELEAMDLKIHIKRNEYLEVFEQRNILEKMYRKHAMEIKNWVQFKEERERSEKYEKERERAVIIVQTWWRGIIVRLKLGPFRPAAKKRAGRKKRSKKI